jgi:methylase of polypeptide subunit release factors
LGAPHGKERGEAPPRSSGSILELNAGTGSDAAYFADKGFLVHATDVADGMVNAIKEKAARLPERLTVQQLSFTELESVEGAPFDLVFSNFGGLNCIPDLRLSRNT